MIMEGPTTDSPAKAHAAFALQLFSWITAFSASAQARSPMQEPFPTLNGCPEVDPRSSTYLLNTRTIELVSARREHSYETEANDFRAYAVHEIPPWQESAKAKRDRELQASILLLQISSSKE